VQVERKHPAETGDSEVVICPTCNGTGKNRYGNVCGSAQADTPACHGSGWMYQQRFDASGRPIRVELVDKLKK